jgi:hypothetical protein
MEKIKAHLILEILGRPKDNVEETLSTLVTKLGSEKGVKILDKNIHDAIPAKDSKDLFTSFAEIDVEFEKLENYFGILFAYMPANIEIINPESLTISNDQLSEIGNILLQRLHNYDAIAKNIMMERDMLTKKLFEVAPHLFKKPEPSPPKKESLEDLAKEKKPKKKTAKKSTKKKTKKTPKKK